MDSNLLHNELLFKAVRSGGKGGQNVNKVSTKVELYFDIPRSMALSDEQKTLLLTKFINKVDRNGVLKISSQTERSQFLNKAIAVKKFDELIASAFIKRKKRVKTKPSTVSKEERLASKKIVSQKKSLRSKKHYDSE
jgi:ribosome-associated protein